MSTKTITYNWIDDESLDSVTIDGEWFECEEDYRVTIPSKILKTVKTKDLHEKVIIDVCENISDGTIIISSVPYSIQKVDVTKLRIEFDDAGTRKYWEGDVGFKRYMETKRDIISERQTEIGDVFLDDYNDQGDWIHLGYYSEIEAENIDIAIQQTEQLIQEIEGATDLALGNPFKKLKDTKSESDFTIGLIIPLLRKIGFINVKFNHGRREFDKDIIFARKTEFDEIEYWGAQVKYGDIAGGANSEIDMIISQSEDAFRMPFYDVYSRTKQRISKLIVVSSGRFKENAVEKICEGIESHSLKNNIMFIDGDKIDTLIEKFRK